MTDKQHDPPAQTPSFVAEDSATADAEKPAVAPEVVSGDAPDDAGDPQQRAADDFAVDDAITKTALDPPAGRE